MLPGLISGNGAGNPITGPISFVGSATLAGSGSLSLTSLTGGSGTQPIEGDLVICAIGAMDAPGSNQAMSISTPSGYTEVADLFADSSLYDTNLGVYYKLQGSTPDTSITIPNYGTTRAIAYVLRGVHQTTPIDATTTTATGPSGGALNPPSITTATANSWVIAIGCASFGTSATAPSGYSNLANTPTGAPNPPLILIARKLVAAAGAEDPASFGIGYTPPSNEAWCAATMAIRTA